MRRAVAELCQRGIAGICIEDKLFPKTNSFLGEGQPLADVDEFCGKIKAGKDSQTDPDFSIVARIEALISGWGLDEALRRAEAYHAAGADAVLIHSKKSDAEEVLAFAREWANHNLRASITAMRDVSSRIFRDQSLAGVEHEIVSVADVFEIAGNAELAAAEKRYPPSDQSSPKAVVLAASRGAGLAELTEYRPKCMIDVRGQPLLRRLTRTLKGAGIRDVTVARGYKKDAINLPSIHTVDNDLYASTGEAASLACAADHISGDCVIAYGDILFRQYYLDQLLEAEDDLVVAVDALWRNRQSDTEDWVRDFVTCSRSFSGDYLDDDPVYLTRMANDVDAAQVNGEWIGLARLSAKGSELVGTAMDDMKADGTLQQARLLDLFSRLAGEGRKVRVIYVPGQWMDVDDVADLSAAGKFL